MPTIAQVLQGQQDPERPDRHYVAKVKAITAPWATCDFYNVRDCQAVIPKGLAVAVGETVLVLVGRAANVVLCVLETKS